METTNQPSLSKKQLIKSVIIAAIIGAVVLVVAVLPAEYGRDLTGLGKVFGFDKLYVGQSEEENIDGTLQVVPKNVKRLKLEKLGSGPDVVKPSEAQSPPPEKQLEIRSDAITIVVPSGKGLEYKFKALKLGSVKYDWSTSKNDIVYIDFHGEVHEENPPEQVFFESYTLAHSNNMAGTFTAPFDGKHGWYFRNRNVFDVTITLNLEGQYELLAEYEKVGQTN
ncbi:hypothetical protein FEE95_20005 [Maribacter algarum]|uniref:Transmembrane anchor protein n=1 Tax=Maribacter algarum (ex Zhang et al. 2020) TaxID=2578118 RepID=A0A5S3PJ30_9FLAO|nr:hypothetical protein [Maribacter algarum]TMM53349.1 hypothetical protein FEE95_20005 [Maribacter algarum]